jgi:hypothetical protein
MYICLGVSVCSGGCAREMFLKITALFGHYGPLRNTRLSCRKSENGGPVQSKAGDTLLMMSVWLHPVHNPFTAHMVRGGVENYYFGYLSQVVIHIVFCESFFPQSFFWVGHFLELN